jgi:hypothetical protein
MRQKIVLIGAHPIADTVIGRFMEAHPEIEIVQVTGHSKNPFEPEPMPIYNFRDIDAKEPVFYENEPSKFIGKPKNNFRKR